MLGCDFVGTVTQTHPSVSKLEVGDKIAALVWGGKLAPMVTYNGILLIMSTIGEIKALGAYS